MMNTNQNYSQEDIEEISLRDLFMALWKHKIFIIIITVLAALAAGIFSNFVLKPVYHARLNIIINMPETYQTKYGEYYLPITTNEQYINLITSSDILKNTIEDMGYDPADMTVEALKDSITIVQPDSKNTTNNSFEIRVASDDPEKARQLAQALYNNYIKFLDVMTAEGAVKYFTDYYSVQLSSLKVELETNKELLEKYNELLKDTPMTINQKEALDSIKSSGNTSDIIVLDNIINPNYTALELEIINLKQTINSIESNIDLYNTYLKELEAEKNEIAQYYNTGDIKESNPDFTRATTSNIYLVSEPVAPSRKTSPNNLRNILIGALLGVMVSILVALIKEFWFTKEVKAQ